MQLDKPTNTELRAPEPALQIHAYYVVYYSRASITDCCYGLLLGRGHMVVSRGEEDQSAYGAARLVLPSSEWDIYIGDSCLASLRSSQIN